jgi:DNA-binding response OmpR family regulator
LVIDDDLGTLKVLSNVLERKGFAVLQEQEALAVLDVLAETTPDLLIVDIAMPGMNGIELCRSIRARPETARTPVLTLSAPQDPQSAEESLRAGADDHLPKPVLPHDLLAKVRVLLGLAEEVFQPLAKGHTAGSAE